MDYIHIWILYWKVRDAFKYTQTFKRAVLYVIVWSVSFWPTYQHVHNNTCRIEIWSTGKDNIGIRLGYAQKDLEYNELENLVHLNILILKYYILNIHLIPGICLKNPFFFINIKTNFRALHFRQILALFVFLTSSVMSVSTTPGSSPNPIGPATFGRLNDLHLYRSGVGFSGKHLYFKNTGKPLISSKCPLPTPSPVIFTTAGCVLFQ